MKRPSPVVNGDFGSFRCIIKYTAEDWEWLLAEAGFHLRSHLSLHPSRQIFVMTVRGESSREMTEEQNVRRSQNG